MVGIALVNGIYDLVALLQQAGSKGCVGLHPIPWTSARRAESADNLIQVPEVIAFQPGDLALRGHQHTGSVVKAIPTIQRVKRYGNGLGIALQQPDVPLLGIGFHQPQLELRRQFAAVQLPNQAALPGRGMEIRPLRRRHQAGLAPDQSQQRAFGGRSGNDAHISIREGKEP